jgi:hypothetical protein
MLNHQPTQICESLIAPIPRSRGLVVDIDLIFRKGITRSQFGAFRLGDMRAGRQGFLFYLNQRSDEQPEPGLPLKTVRKASMPIRSDSRVLFRCDSIPGILESFT